MGVGSADLKGYAFAFAEGCGGSRESQKLLIALAVELASGTIEIDTVDFRFCEGVQLVVDSVPLDILGFVEREKQRRPCAFQELCPGYAGGAENWIRFFLWPSCSLFAGFRGRFELIRKSDSPRSPHVLLLAAQKDA